MIVKILLYTDKGSYSMNRKKSEKIGLDSHDN